MKKLSLSPGIFLIFTVLLACTPKSIPVEKPVTVSTLLSEPKAGVKEPWEMEWEKTLKAARSEGRVVIVSTAGSPVRTALMESIKKKYNLDLEIIVGKGSEVAAKIFSERRAGLYLIDVYIGGATTVHTQLKPAGVIEPLDSAFILPELKDPEIIKKNWFGGEMRWLDDKRLTLAMTSYSSPSIAINNNLVKPGEVKGYADLLDTKWKGKIILNDPTQAGTGGKHFGVVGSRIMGFDYWEKMLKQEPVIVVDQRLMVEWLAKGRYAAIIGVKPEIVQEFVDAGAPLDMVRPVEGSYLTSGSGTIFYMKNAPHPNAAKIFINWILTREGQTVFSKALAAPSARVDVPTEGIDPNLMLKPGVKYLDSDDEKFSLEQPEHFERAKKLFAPLMK